MVQDVFLRIAIAGTRIYVVQAQTAAGPVPAVPVRFLAEQLGLSGATQTVKCETNPIISPHLIRVERPVDGRGTRELLCLTPHGLAMFTARIQVNRLKSKQRQQRAMALAEHGAAILEKWQQAGFTQGSFNDYPVMFSVFPATQAPKAPTARKQVPLRTAHKIAASLIALKDRPDFQAIVIDAYRKAGVANLDAILKELSNQPAPTVTRTQEPPAPPAKSNVVPMKTKQFSPEAIAVKLGILTRQNHPHAKAVHAILTGLDIPYDTVKYPTSRSDNADERVLYQQEDLDSLANWLEHTGYPSFIHVDEIGKGFWIKYANRTSSGKSATVYRPKRASV